MASPKTLSQQASAPSRFARQMAVTAPVNQAQLIQQAPGARPVLQSWLSTDGRAVYAYDGVSIRKVKG